MRILSRIEMLMSGNSPKTQAKPRKLPAFETALAELEQVVAEMEAGQLPLEEAMAAYRHGTELLQHCRARLEDAQQQVRILEEGALKKFAAGVAGDPCGAGDAAKREDA